MTPAAERFALLLSKSSLLLKQEGFRRKGSAFYHKWEHGFGIIQFQKSLKSTRHCVIFTVNLGIGVWPVAEFFDPGDRKEALVNCQLRWRVGGLLAERQDKWWELHEHAGPESDLVEIPGILLGTCVPFVKNLQNLDRIVALWSAGDPAGLTDIQRLVYLAVLLKFTGRTTELASAIDGLEASRQAPLLVRAYLEKLKA